MAITLDLIKEYCGERELKYQEEEGKLLLGFMHELPDGEAAKIHMGIHLLEDGELFMLECIVLPPGALKEHENREAFLLSLLHHGWMTPFGAAEMDDDGELRFRVEMPLEDNTLTIKQFTRIYETALVATGMLKMFAKQAFGEVAASTESALERHEQVKKLVSGVIDANFTLNDPNATEAEKQAARELIESARKVLPAEIWQAVEAGMTAQMGKTSDDDVMI